MITEKHQDGTPKPPGLYVWQLKHNVDDENPIFEVIAQFFALLAILPELVAQMAQEREAAAQQHEKHMAELDAQHAAFLATFEAAVASLSDTCQKAEDLVERGERLLYHLREIETKQADVSKHVADNIDYELIAKGLNGRVAEICEKLPLDRVDQQVQHLANAGDRIELAGNRMERSAEAMADYKNSKRDLLVPLVCAVWGTAILVLGLYLLACLPRVLPHATQAQATNAITSSVTEPPPATQYVPIGAPFSDHGKIYIQIQPPEQY